MENRIRGQRDYGRPAETVSALRAGRADRLETATYLPAKEEPAMLRLVLMTCVVLSCADIARADSPRAATRDQLGRSVKLRVLVDKVMQPTAGWITEEWMVKATADAGFNVFSPRSGHDRLDEVRQVTTWCKRYGIYHMP